MFSLIFILAALTVINPLWRIVKRRELNIFDLSLIFSFLYFIVIPSQDFLVNHLRPEYLTRSNTAFALLVYMYGLLGASLLCRRRKNSWLSITSQLTRIKTIPVKNAFHWFAFFYILFMFLQVTNYSALSEDNLEGNNSFFYGVDAGFFERVIVLSFKPMFPALFVILMKSKPVSFFVRQLRNINLILLIITLLLGEKTFMTFSFIFMLLYYYSIKREQLKLKHLCLGAGLVALIFLVIFPLSQSFRLYKQEMVANSKSHTFVDVATGFAEEGVTSDLSEQTEHYQETRSLNVYDALDWAASRTDYQGYGRLTFIVLQYLFPQRMKGDGSIMADMMMGKGSDIGESMLSWYVLDWGVVVGGVVAILHLWALCWGIYVFGMFFNRWIRSSIYPLVVYSYMMRFVISVEHNPASDAHQFYNIFIYVILFAAVVFVCFKKKHEKVIA